MAKRAAVCIGVNHPAGMTPLAGAIQDAIRFEAWAKSQGCDTTLLTDAAGKVRVNDIFDAVNTYVQHGTYDQLIVYFSGHGILKAPGAEFWLLSDAPGNSNEAVNLVISIEAARDSAIPHVAIVSDACRSAADTFSLRALHGGLIFPPLPPPTPRSEIDAYYATLPGDPANEVAMAQATATHSSLFTDCLLETVNSPPAGMVETTSFNGTTINVISSRKLKLHLEATVPIKAGQIHIALRQQPDVQVGTALPKYFAEAPKQITTVVVPAAPAPPPPPAGPVPIDWNAARDVAFGTGAPQVTVPPAAQPVYDQIERIRSAKGRERFETRTGFSIHGAKVTAAFSRLNSDPPFAEGTASGSQADHVRVYDQPGIGACSMLMTLDTGTTALLPIIVGMIGTLVVEDGKVVSVSYLPSRQSDRWSDYELNAERLDKVKAYAAVSSRTSKFELPDESAEALAGRLRQFKGLDPMLGVYAAYGYAQVGRVKDAASVLQYMQLDDLAIPFDVALLARSGPLFSRLAPFGPMLSQGWVRLDQRSPLWRPIHEALRPHLIPSLFTTLDSDGASIARLALERQEVR